MPDGATCPGLLTGADVINLTTRLADAPRSLTLVLENLDRYRAELDALQGAKADHALDDVQLLAPIPRPGKIMALGLNYRDHAAEANMDLPTIQTWFSKVSTSVNGPYAPVQLPRVSDKLDYEAELAFVIGKRIRHATAETARQAIAGYCCANDVSVRDFQFHSTQFIVGKSFDTHCPFGPWLTTADEIADPQKLGIRCTVNGETRQDSNTAEMVFSVYQMVEYLSQAMTLEPGDVILTGTPAGVGAVRTPRLYMKAGDVVRVDIDGLGHIENRIEAEG
jgi:2-keto-4-pentenoate hydratase/2-oxohepta-3-ene-1,7-dioic acid hydratase in catechol pathway